MKTLITYISTLFLLVVFVASCADKKEADASENATKNTNSSENTNELLSGTTSKTWYITKQTDASGDKDKVTSAEKDETLNIYADGKFSIIDATQTASGKWTTEGSHTFTLQFDGKDVTESFSILDLSKEKVVLKAADGSEMTLKEK